MHFTLWPSVRATDGCYGDMPWSDFLAFVASPATATKKETLEGWSPVRFRDNRRKLDRVEAVSCVVLDDDKSGLSTADVIARWQHVAGVVFTTFQHTPTAPRHRIVIRCSRNVTAAEYAHVWAVLRDYAASVGQPLDEQTKDASRFWFVPGHPPGATYAWTELAGKTLDVDAILASSPAEIPAPEPAVNRPISDRLAEPRRNAMAAALGAAWPAKGRHEAQLALAGALRAEGWAEAEAVEFLCTVCRAAGDEDRPKREATCRHTWGREPGAPLTGWTRLKSFIDPLVVDAARGALARDAEWNEQTTRRLAEAAHKTHVAEATDRALDMHAGTLSKLADAPDIITAGPFVFKVGGLDAPLPPLSWAIGDLICRGDVVMLVAHGNSLKTWLAFSLALAIATGRPWLGRFAAAKGRAAILDFESGEYEVTRRFKLLGARDGDVAGRLLRNSYSGAQLVNPETWIALAGLKLEMLVIDSFNAAAPETDENDARAAVMLQHAGKFANATSCTVVVIHHARKSSGGDSREVVRGSTALYAACDRVFKFDEPERADGGIVRSTMRSVKDGAGRSPAPVGVELSDAGLRFVETVKEPEEKPTPEKNRELVLSILRQNSAGVAKEHLVNLMEGKREKKFELLSHLVLAGIAVEYRDGAEKKAFIMLKP